MGLLPFSDLILAVGVFEDTLKIWNRENLMGFYLDFVYCY